MVRRSKRNRKREEVDSEHTFYRFEERRESTSNLSIRSILLYTLLFHSLFSTNQDLNVFFLCIKIKFLVFLRFSIFSETKTNFFQSKSKGFFSKQMIWRRWEEYLLNYLERTRSVSRSINYKVKKKTLLIIVRNPLYIKILPSSKNVYE